MRLAHIFFDVNLKNGHMGLTLLLKKKRLQQGDVAIFVNRRMNAVKIYVNNSYLVYYKHPSGTIEPATLRHLPNYLNGPTLEYKKALTKVIEEKLAKRGNKGHA